MAKVLWVRLLSIGQLKLFRMSVWVKCGGFLRGLFQIFHLISTNMLTDLPEILFYNCPYLALFSVQIVALLHNWVQSCIEICLHASQKHLPNFITWSCKETTALWKDSWVLRRTIGIIIPSTSNQSGFKKPINCWMMGVWKHPHQKLATFLKCQKFKALVLCAV